MNYDTKNSSENEADYFHKYKEYNAKNSELKISEVFDNTYPEKGKCFFSHLPIEMNQNISNFLTNKEIFYFALANKEVKESVTREIRNRLLDKAFSFLKSDLQHLNLSEKILAFQNIKNHLDCNFLFNIDTPCFYIKSHRRDSLQIGTSPNLNHFIDCDCVSL